MPKMWELPWLATEILRCAAALAHCIARLPGTQKGKRHQHSAGLVWNEWIFNEIGGSTKFLWH